MSEAADRLRTAAVERALRGPGTTSIDARRAAFDNANVDPRARALVDKVARHAWKVTNADVAGAKAAGLPEDEIFELAVCAALGQATRQWEAAIACLADAQPVVERSGSEGGGDTR
jgi:hypothetical protein